LNQRIECHEEAGNRRRNSGRTLCISGGGCICHKLYTASKACRPLSEGSSRRLFTKSQPHEYGARAARCAEGDHRTPRGGGGARHNHWSPWISEVDQITTQCQIPRKLLRHKELASLIIHRFGERLPRGDLPPRSRTRVRIEGWIWPRAPKCRLRHRQTKCRERGCPFSRASEPTLQRNEHLQLSRRPTCERIRSEQCEELTAKIASEGDLGRRLTRSHR
jgi:hypothetical protein